MVKPETNPGTPNNCPKCGAPVSAAALAGLCPACLLQQGAVGETKAQSSATTFETPTRQEIVRLFPQLEIIQLIGKGGMGMVYKARQPSLDRFVALKILPVEATDSSGFAERFNREARALARLNHPNIVAVYEFGQVSGLLFFVMEYVDGPNLRRLEQSERLSPHEALRIVPQICEALQFAHEAGIVHRDIKPENILVDKKGRVKIADFGIAKIMGREKPGVAITETKQAIGTPHYMAPEQLEKPQTVDHRADIYSLGVVFYEMLTGELPLGKFAPPSRRVQVDVRLDEVVLRALEKQPEQRYQHVSEVKTDLEKVVTTPLQVEHRQGTKSVLPTRRKSILAAIIIALFLLSLGLVLSRLTKGKGELNNADVVRPKGEEGISETWHTTKIATLDEKTGILSAKLRDVGLFEFLAVCRVPANTNYIWRADGRPVTNTLDEFGNEVRRLIGLDGNVAMLPGLRGSPKCRSFLFRSPHWDYKIEFEPKPEDLIYEGNAEGCHVKWGTFPYSARAVRMRVRCPFGPWVPLSTVDRNGKVLNRPQREGDPDFKADWNVLFSKDGSADIKLLLNIDHRFCEVNITAIDTNGIAQQTAIVEEKQRGKTAFYSFWLEGGGAEIKEFRAEVRPVQWVEFPNIALQPTVPGPGVGMAIEAGGLSKKWNSTQVATLDKKTGILGAKLPDVGLFEFLAVCRVPANTNYLWRADGRPIAGGLAELGNNVKRLIGLGEATLPGDGDRAGWPKCRSFVFRTPNSDYSVNFEPQPDHYISSGDEDGCRVQTLAFPDSAHAVKMRMRCPLGEWMPISTVDRERKVYNRPRKEGDPEFKPDWDVSFHRNGNADIKLFLRADPRFFDVQVVAVDTNGVRQSISAVEQTQTEETAVYRFSFTREPSHEHEIIEVSEFRAEVRPVQWVEFPNIALQPNVPDLAPPTGQEGVSEVWHTTQVATLDKKTGILSAKLRDVGLVELLAVCRISTNDTPTDANQICIPTKANDVWRGDGTTVDSIPADFGQILSNCGMAIGSEYQGPIESVQYRSLLFRVANSDYTRIEFEPGAHVLSRHLVRGLALVRGLDLTTFLIPVSARTVTMRLGCPTQSAWLPISTVDVHGQVYNRPPREGVPDFRPDWTVSLSADGGASITLLLNVDHQFCDVQAIVVDTNGAAHPSQEWSQPVQIGKTAVYSLYSRKLEAGEFKEFRAEVRPVQWVEFPNIALQPAVLSRIPK